MKFRQKIYCCTILLFIIVLNLSLLTVIHVMYQNNLSLEKERSFVEVNYIADTLSVDASNHFSKQSITKESLAKIISSYSSVYEKHNTWLALYTKESQIFDAIPFPNIVQKIPDSFGSHASLLYKENKITYFCISLPVSIRSIDYQLFYVRELTELQNYLNQLTRLSLAICVLSISFLSIVLFFMLRHFISPLSKLSAAASKVGAGNYTQKVEVIGNDEIADLTCHFNDMTEEIQKKVSSLEKEQELKQRLIDNLSHEMRTPLTSIYGYAEYLLLSPTDEEERYNVLQYILSESSRLSLMGNRLLMLSQLKEPQLVYDTVSLHALFSKIEDTLSFILKERNVQLVLCAAEFSFPGDAVLLESLLQNLIENAIYASIIGGQVTVTAHKEEGILSIVICDNGVGISEDALLHITEPFYRVDKARSRSDGGAGIGLSLCKAIVAALGGTMRFSSKLGEGTEVSLTFTTP